MLHTHVYGSLTSKSRGEGRGVRRDERGTERNKGERRAEERVRRQEEKNMGRGKMEG